MRRGGGSGEGIHAYAQVARGKTSPPRVDTATATETLLQRAAHNK